MPGLQALMLLIGYFIANGEIKTQFLDFKYREDVKLYYKKNKNSKTVS
jgi:hypothetical protein